jgi:anti-anti-sigma regulatory factor
VATQITQIDNAENGLTTLRVEGDLLPDDARVIESIANGIRSETGNRVLIDLADLDFLDSETAPLLRRLDEREGVDIQGVEIFLQTVVNQVERHGR